MIYMVFCMSQLAQNFFHQRYHRDSSNPRHFEQTSKSNVFALPQEPVQQNKIDSRSRFVQRIDNLWNNLVASIRRLENAMSWQLNFVWMKINNESARICRNTLPETNIEPENWPSQKESSIRTIHFQVLC